MVGFLALNQAVEVQILLPELLVIRQGCLAFSKLIHMQDILLHLLFLTDPYLCGGAWSPRRPVTAEIAGSNPVGGALVER